MINASSSKKVGEKSFIDVMLWEDGMWHPYITDVQAQYVKRKGKDGKDHWFFDQFEGHIYIHKKGAGKVVPTGSKWFWGIDWRKGSRNYGHLYRDLTLKDDPYKVVLMARNGVPFDPWSIARAVHEHFAPAAPAQQTKAPVPQTSITEAKPVPSQSVAEPIIPAPVQKAALPDITPEDMVAVDEDLAMLDKETKSPLERLQAGDVSIFLELGVSQVRASKWAQQIREGVKIEKIEDISVIKGVGPHMAEKLVKVWNEKFSA